jgi:nicotinamide-nucleotide amidase
VSRLLAPGGPDAVAVVLVGDELLLGAVADTNGAWLARTLTGSGLRVVDVEVAPDDEQRIAAAVRRVAGLARTVVVSGGIGPTSDDVTRAALARACGCALVRDDDAGRQISEWFTSHGRSVPEPALRMAERPACAAMVVNPHGSAPGVRLDLAGTTVYAVPGVPAELRSMVRSVVLPAILAGVGATVRTASTSLEVVLLGESAVARRLAAVEADIDTDPTAELAYLARPAHVSVRLSVRREPPDQAQARLDDLVVRAEAALGADVMGRDGVSLPAVVLRLLVEAEQTVSVAESLTGGGVAEALTSVPGASAAVRGGVVAYTGEVKSALLDVSPGLLAAHGAVHPEVAAQMARGVRRRIGADWGVATTGVAGPDSADGQPPGTVHVAVDGPQTRRVRTLNLPGDRVRIRTLAVAHALDLLRRSVAGLPEPGNARESETRQGR